ncbi:hypothetical protein [Priestia aryabhattai]
MRENIEKVNEEKIIKLIEEKREELRLLEDFYKIRESASTVSRKILDDLIFEWFYEVTAYPDNNNITCLYKAMSPNGRNRVFVYVLIDSGIFELRAEDGEKKGTFKFDPNDYSTFNDALRLTNFS